MRAMIYAAVTMLLALALMACEDGNPAHRDGEGGGGGAGGEGGAAGEGGAGGEGGAEPDVDAAPLPEPGWSESGTWIGWPDDPSDMDRRTSYDCSDRCGGCREILVFNLDGWRYDTDQGHPATFPVDTEIRLKYAMKIGNCIATDTLPIVAPFEGGPYVFDMYGNGTVQIEPTDGEGWGKIVINTGPRPQASRMGFIWPSRRGGTASFYFDTFDSTPDE